MCGQTVVVSITDGSDAFPLEEMGILKTWL